MSRMAPRSPTRGTVRDGVFAEQVVELFGELAQAASDGPWLAVASFVNPHDIAFAGGLYKLLLGFEPSDDTVPDIPEPPSQGDSFAGRPRVPGAVQDGVAADDRRAAGRPGLPPALLLPAQGRRSGDRSDPRLAGGVGHGRRHDRGVHLRPRRPARRPRRHAAEVVQRVRRSDPRPDDRARPRRHTRRRWHHHTDQPRRPDPDPDGPRRHRRRTSRGRGGRAPHRGPSAARPRPQRSSSRARPRPRRSRRRSTS